MKITGVKAFFPKYRHVPPSWRTHFWQIVVRVETDLGVVGLGYGGGGVAGVARSIACPTRSICSSPVFISYRYDGAA